MAFLPRFTHPRIVGTALLALTAAACQTPQQPSTGVSRPPTVTRPVQPAEPALPARTGYTCCNLHYEGDWISSANWGALPFIPAGTPITLKGSERGRLLVEINGKPMRIGLDYGKEQLTLAKYADQIILAQDPRGTLAKWPDQVQQAIKEGKVMIGMTREQAIMAIGYPQADQTRSTSEPKWNHWASSFGQYVLIWDKSGKLAKVETDAATYAKMVLRPR